MRNDANGHQLLAVVSAVHHERVGESLNDGALCFSESLRRISAGRVGDVDWLSDLNVIPVKLLSDVPSLFLHYCSGAAYVKEISLISTSS